MKALMMESSCPAGTEIREAKDVDEGDGRAFLPRVLS